MNRILILSSIIGLLVGTSAWAGSLTVPNTFVGGQKALASEVNANFDEVEAQVMDNAENISSNSDSITDVKDQLSYKLDALSCSDGQVLKYNVGTSSYECADDLDTSNSNALTLEGRPASDFADSGHSHTGVNVLFSELITSTILGIGGNKLIQFPIPNSLANGGDIKIEFLLRKYEAAVTPGQMVFYLEITEISEGGVFDVSPSLVGLEQAVNVSGEQGQTVYKVTWSITVGSCDFLKVRIWRNTYGGLTDTSPAMPLLLSGEVYQYVN